MAPASPGMRPTTNNVLQAWVKTLGKDDDRIVTADKKRGIYECSWAKDNQTLLYTQDSDEYEATTARLR